MLLVFWEWVVLNIPKLFLLFSSKEKSLDPNQTSTKVLILVMTSKNMNLIFLKNIPGKRIITSFSICLGEKKNNFYDY